MTKPGSILTAVEAATQFRAGELTPSALTDQLLARIERENPKLNAFYEIFQDQARADAARATRELTSGQDRGPLHGIPIAIKDLFDVKGSVTTAGAHPGFRPPPAAEDCEVVARLRAAGAVLLGKTGLHEWALGLSNNNEHFGPTRNPWDLARIPGGSSGGSAAALSAGLTPLALGTDTGGSIRVPAALCGVVGLKPTYGRVSLRAVTPLSRSLDHAGPMANTVEDAFLLLEAISEFRRAPSPSPRLLLWEGFFLDEVEPEIRRLVRAAADLLGPPGAVDLGDLSAVREANTVILYSDAAAYHEERLKAHPDWFGRSLRDRLPAGLAYRGVDYARARDVQRAWTAKLTELMGEDGVLALPATSVPATPIGDPDGAELAKIMTRLTTPFNLSGTPVLALPVGTVRGLPVGMQLVAGPGQESLLLHAGKKIEAGLQAGVSL